MTHKKFHIRTRTSRIPHIYIPPLMTPLYWRDESSGELPSAVDAYMKNRIGGPPCTKPQLDLICDFILYFIHAPCWMNNLHDNDDMLAELQQLQERAHTLASAESVAAWTEEATHLGLDPW